MVDEAKRDATAVAKVVEGRAEQQLDSAKEAVAGRADNMANAVDTLARELRENDEGWLGDKAAAFAATVRRTGQQLQERRVDELADDVRDWSRNPAVFLSGAFALGLVAGRFLKSSARQSDAYQGGRTPDAYPGARQSDAYTSGRQPEIYAGVRQPIGEVTR